MAGIIAFMGYDGSVYIMGWTGGYVLLALLLAPYLRKFGQYTVPDFIGTRFYGNWARIVAVLCLVIVSFTYIAGQMRGVGIVFSRFVDVDIETGVIIGMAVVFLYAVLGGMKGITYTQVAQYCVLIFAYLVPAVFISIMVTGHPLPQIGLGADVADGSGESVLQRLDRTLVDLGFTAYTQGTKSTIDVFAITFALMVGTAGLPHVIVRFFTVPNVADARRSAGWALIFIALLYTTAPAVAAFARLNFNETVANTRYQDIDPWFHSWEDIGLIAWADKNNDGVMQYGPGAPFAGTPTFSADRGPAGERLVTNEPSPTTNEVYVDRDIMVLANPDIAGLPPWVVALVAAGAIAAALSTAAGLLLVISTSVAHDLLKNAFARQLSERAELASARIAAAVAVGVAGYLGINPPGFVAEVVAFAFGLAAASLFPAILLGIFSRRMNREGAVAGMLAGLTFTLAYLIWFKFVNPAANTAEHWWFGISPEGIGAVGALVNVSVAAVVARFTPPPPAEIQTLLESIRVPRGAGASIAH
jgi:cation/acetate symporter